MANRSELADAIAAWIVDRELAEAIATRRLTAREIRQLIAELRGLYARGACDAARDIAAGGDADIASSAQLTRSSMLDTARLFMEEFEPQIIRDPQQGDSWN